MLCHYHLPEPSLPSIFTTFTDRPCPTQIDCKILMQHLPSCTSESSAKKAWWRVQNKLKNGALIAGNGNDADGDTSAAAVTASSNTGRATVNNNKRKIARQGSEADDDDVEEGVKPRVKKARKAAKLCKVAVKQEADEVSTIC